MATTVFSPITTISSWSSNASLTERQFHLRCCSAINGRNRKHSPSLFFHSLSLTSHRCGIITPCLSSFSVPNSTPSTKLYVSGLSFRTTEESLRSAFENFGQLVEVNLVMDKIANRPRGFAFIRYALEEESQKAIEGMHGKFLDGRVIFVEVAKPRSELRQGVQQKPRTGLESWT